MLKKGMILKNGIASPATMCRMLCSIDEELFLYAFMEWIAEILDPKGRHLAIDGKAIIAAASKVKGTTTPMLLNVIDTATSLVIAQMPIESKENEIVKIPVLLKLLNIQECTITTDAIGTQTSIMEQIVSQGGHFVQVVKKNQPNSYGELCFQFSDKKVKYDEHISKEKNRDRYEYRNCKISTDLEYLTKGKKEWPFVKSVGCISHTRILLIRDEYGNDITPDLNTFQHSGTFRQPIPSSGDNRNDDNQVIGIISDLELTAEEAEKCRRDHWSVENRLHHVLDDTFREDRSPAKKSKNNFALIRKIAYNLVRIAAIQQSLIQPITELLDLFSDDKHLLEKYLFKGIPCIP